MGSPDAVSSPHPPRPSSSLLRGLDRHVEIKNLPTVPARVTLAASGYSSV